MLGEPQLEPCVPKSHEGETCEPMICEPILVPEVLVDRVPTTDELITYDRVTLETYDPMPQLTKL